jgi:hypothetical protein
LSGEFLGDFSRPIIDGDLIPTRGDVACEVGSHDGEPDHGDRVL